VDVLDARKLARALALLNAEAVAAHLEQPLERHLDVALEVAPLGRAPAQAVLEVGATAREAPTAKMADAVQALMEEMVPELQQFWEHGLLSKTEVRVLVKKRTSSSRSNILPACQAAQTVALSATLRSNAREERSTRDRKMPSGSCTVRQGHVHALQRARYSSGAATSTSCARQTRKFGHKGAPGAAKMHRGGPCLHGRPETDQA
jgi:hypothetical protein